MARDRIASGTDRPDFEKEEEADIIRRRRALRNRRRTSVHSGETDLQNTLLENPPIHPAEASEQEAEIERSKAFQKDIAGRAPASKLEEGNPDLEEAIIKREIVKEDRRQVEMAKGEAIIAASPADFNQVVQSKVEDGTMPEQVGKELQDAVNQGQPITSVSESSPLKKQFAEGLAAFLPTIVGAAFGGSKGALEGAKVTESILSSAGATTKKKFQQTGFVDESGRPISFDPATNTHTKVDGTKADKFVDPVTGRQTRNIKFKTKKAAQLSDKQQEVFAAADTLEKQIDRMDKLKSAVNTGPLEGRIQSLAQMVDLAPKEFVKIRAMGSGVILAFTKMMQGARASDMDLEFVRQMAPDENDDDRTYADKLEVLIDFMNDKRGSILRSIKLGQPLKAGTVEKFLQDRKKSPKGKVTKEDIKKMSTEELKAYLGRK